MSEKSKGPSEEEVKSKTTEELIQKGIKENGLWGTEGKEIKSRLEQQKEVISKKTLSDLRKVAKQFNWSGLVQVIDKRLNEATEAPATETPSTETEETPATETKDTPANETQETPATETKDTPANETQETPETKTPEAEKTSPDNQKEKGQDKKDDNEASEEILTIEEKTRVMKILGITEEISDEKLQEAFEISDLSKLFPSMKVLILNAELIHLSEKKDILKKIGFSAVDLDKFPDNIIVWVSNDNKLIVGIEENYKIQIQFDFETKIIIKSPEVTNTKEGEKILQESASDAQKDKGQDKEDNNEASEEILTIEEKTRVMKILGITEEISDEKLQEAFEISDLSKLFPSMKVLILNAELIHLSEKKDILKKIGFSAVDLDKFPDNMIVWITKENKLVIGIEENSKIQIQLDLETKIVIKPKEGEKFLQESASDAQKDKGQDKKDDNEASEEILTIEEKTRVMKILGITEEISDEKLQEAFEISDLSKLFPSMKVLILNAELIHLSEKKDILKKIGFSAVDLDKFPDNMIVWITKDNKLVIGIEENSKIQIQLDLETKIVIKPKEGEKFLHDKYEKTEDLNENDGQKIINGIIEKKYIYNNDIFEIEKIFLRGDKINIDSLKQLKKIAGISTPMYDKIDKKIIENTPTDDIINNIFERNKDKFDITKQFLYYGLTLNEKMVLEVRLKDRGESINAGTFKKLQEIVKWDKSSDILDDFVKNYS